MRPHHRTDAQPRDHVPTVLQYAVSAVGREWVLSCESVPIASFASRTAARRAARAHVAAARARGDCGLLTMEGADAA